MIDLRRNLELASRELARGATIAGLAVTFCAGPLSAPSSAAPAVALTHAHTTPIVGAHQETAPELPACLLGDWRHSHEEDTTELRVYRPAEYPIPPSRGRTGFAFLAAGEVIAFGIAPADGLLETRGEWTVTPPNFVSITRGGELTGPETLDVVSCSDELLFIAAP